MVTAAQRCLASHLFDETTVIEDINPKARERPNKSFDMHAWVAPDIARDECMEVPWRDVRILPKSHDAFVDLPCEGHQLHT